MVKGNIKSLSGETTKKMDLPSVFEVPFRPDLIKRAVLSDESKKRQKQGRSKLAGKLTAATSVGPGRGISLVPRTHAKGTHHASRGAVVPSTRGGRLAHPPRVEKIIVEKMNKKEYALALKSAVAATADGEVVKERGHRFNEKVEFPIIVEDKFSEIQKTTEVLKVLNNLGLEGDLERTSKRSIRAGKGKGRGRKYRTKKGPLLVVAEKCSTLNAAKNIPGVNIMTVKELRITDLAPGTSPGRVTVWTESAVKSMEEWK